MRYNPEGALARERLLKTGSDSPGKKSYVVIEQGYDTKHCKKRSLKSEASFKTGGRGKKSTSVRYFSEFSWLELHCL